MLSTLRYGAFLRSNRLNSITRLSNNKSNIDICPYCKGDTCLNCGLSGYIVKKDETWFKDRKEDLVKRSYFYRLGETSFPKIPPDKEE
jgi:hypothetical protein